MPKGIPLTEQELEARRREIAHTAGALILEKGFIETSVNQIAKNAGMGKSTLYDYFASKEAILLYLLDEYLLKLSQRAEAILKTDKGVIERLQQVLHMHLEVLYGEKASFLNLILEAQRLSSEGQFHYQQMRYAYQDLIRDLIQEGVTNGTFRPVDPGLVMRSLLAIITSVVFTSRPNGTPQEMLDKALEMILKGIMQKSG